MHRSARAYASRFCRLAQSCFNRHADRRVHLQRLAGARRQSSAPRSSPGDGAANRPERKLGARFGVVWRNPRRASAALIEKLDAETKRAIIEFGLRLEVIGYMVFHRLVDLKTANDLNGALSLPTGRAPRRGRKKRARGNAEFLEWCEWLGDAGRAAARHLCLRAGLQPTRGLARANLTRRLAEGDTALDQAENHFESASR